MEHILNLEQVKKYYGGNSGNTDNTGGKSAARCYANM